MIEPSGFREIARSVSTSYPIPFVFALCLAFAVLTPGGAIFTDAPLRCVFVGFAGLSVLFAFGLITRAASRRQELLRSEKLEIAHRVLDRIGDSDLSPQTIDQVGRILLGQPRSTRRNAKSGDSGDV